MKRILSGLIIGIIVFIVLIFGNIYVVDTFLGIMALISIKELYDVLNKKKYHPVKWIGYLVSIGICFLHVIPSDYLYTYILALITLSMILLFITTIVKYRKVSIGDIAVTILGICYIDLMIMFISLIRAFENGKFLVWYLFICAWATDVFALVFGILFGKHHFTEVSPKKTIEGCIGGTTMAIVAMIIYTVVINKTVGLTINVGWIAFASLFISLIGQMGDLAASVIKRYAKVKDYGNLIPGHGGMLDRIDSLLFIAPITYFCLLFLI